MKGSTVFRSKTSEKKNTRFPAKRRKKKKKTRAVSAVLLRSRVKMCKMRSVFPFPVTLTPSYESYLTKQAAENGGITQFL